MEIHVRPSSSATVVGGEYDGALVVRVVEPADSGRATGAALRAVAKAVAVSPRSVRLVRGATSRRKLIEIEVGHHEAQSVKIALQQLRRPQATGIPEYALLGPTLAVEADPDLNQARCGGNRLRAPSEE